MIQKVFLVSTLATLASVMAQGATIQQIQVGQISGGNNLGLTAAQTLNTGSSTSGTGLVVAASGPTTHVTLATYNNFMFDGATQGGSAVAIPSGSAAATTQVSDPTNGVTFDLIGSGGNTWYNNSVPNTDSIVVPINMSGVQTVWTMLNDMAGSNTDVIFFFNSSDNVAGATQVQVDLVDGQEIRSSILCATGCPAGATNGLTGGTPNYFVNGSATASGTLGVTTGSIQSPAGTTWNPAYNGTATTTPAQTFAGSTGTLTLDDQGFNVSALTSLYGPYLVQLEVVQASTATNPTGNGHFYLEAVTIGAQTPEPSTFFLLAAGIGLMGFAMARRNRKSVSL